jgi:aminoglycoside 3-N-acetyltransferase
VPEKTSIDHSAAPQTVESLAHDLGRLGLRSGGTVVVHSSLSSLGWVCGGAVAVVEALLSALGPAGTLVVPTHSGDLSDPAEWANPSVPESWWATIRATMPPFRPATTPTRGMGAVPEVVRTWPGARRSDHPQLSFTAVGPQASRVTGAHSLADGLGEGSPLARLYELDAAILLLGVGHDRNTSLHLAEYRSGVRRPVQQSGPVLVDGERRWVTWSDIDLDESDFVPLGADLERDGLVHRGPVGAASARLMQQRLVVDYATAWFRRRST